MTQLVHQRSTESVFAAGAADRIRLLIGHLGEDATLVRNEYREPGSDRVAVVLFAHGVLPRPELCTKQSIAAALGLVRSEIDALSKQDGETLRTFWIGLCERFSVACKLELGK